MVPMNSLPPSIATPRLLLPQQTVTINTEPAKEAQALEEATLADLQAGMASGRMTARSITQQYLDRIAELDRKGPMLRNVLETNPDALSTPTPFTFGSAPRTIPTVLQPGARDVSMSIFKEFPLSKVREGMRAEFRAESFNTFNHPHFQGPDTTVGSSTFGLITGVVNNPRQLQLALKVYF